MLAELLDSDVSFLSQKHGGASQRGKTGTQRKEELKRWRKEHQAKVREMYKQEVETKRRPEAHPFNSDKQVVSEIYVFIKIYFIMKTCNSYNIIV